MKKLGRGLLAGALLSLTLWMVGAERASAHGTCAAESGVPSWNGNVSSLNWTWISTGVCDSEHRDTYMRTCLLESPGLLSPTTWSETGICREREWPEYRTNWVLPVQASGGCKPLHWYRTYTVFSPGAGGTHWGTRAYSAAVQPCTYRLVSG